MITEICSNCVIIDLREYDIYVSSLLSFHPIPKAIEKNAAINKGNRLRGILGAVFTFTLSNKQLLTLHTCECASL